MLSCFTPNPSDLPANHLIATIIVTKTDNTSKTLGVLLVPCYLLERNTSRGRANDALLGASILWLSVARLADDAHQQLMRSYAYHPPPKSNSVDNEWFQQHALQNKVGGGSSKGIGEPGSNHLSAFRNSLRTRRHTTH